MKGAISKSWMILHPKIREIGNNKEYSSVRPESNFKLGFVWNISKFDKEKRIL